MTHRVRWREKAGADLDAIYDFIAMQTDAEVALRYVLRIEEAGEKLADFPDRGQPRSEILPGLRSIPFERSATIFYIVDSREVQIVHVIHARRDLNTAFEEV